MNNQIPYKLKEIKSISSIQDFLQISNTIAVLNTKLIDLYNYTNIHFYKLSFNNVINTVFVYKMNDGEQNNIVQFQKCSEDDWLITKKEVLSLGVAF